MDKSSFADLSFEQAMDKLEVIAEQLDQGEVPLEQAIALFQQGMELSRICGQKLNTVEQKIELLIEENGEWNSKRVDLPSSEQEDMI